MKLLILLPPLLLLSACSTKEIDMTPAPTVQLFDLTDIEGDGVIAARDNCPQSIDGALVSNNGCGTETIEVMHHKLEINFENDSFIVTDDHLYEVEMLASFMKDFPQTKVTIEGHTSLLGSVEHNIALSKNRAEAIKLILISQFSIDADRIATVGYGSEQLLVQGDDEAAHARNRRIVGEVSGDKSIPDMKWDIYSVDDELE